MTSTSPKFIPWAPRLAGIVLAGFLALFALDAFDGRSLSATLPAFAIHLLPSLIVLAVVAAAWKWEWIGAAGFIALAIAYAWMAGSRFDWIAVISLPLLVVGLLFFASWRRHASVVR